VSPKSACSILPDHENYWFAGSYFQTAVQCTIGSFLFFLVMDVVKDRPSEPHVFVQNLFLYKRVLVTVHEFCQDVKLLICKMTRLTKKGKTKLLETRLPVCRLSSISLITLRMQLKADVQSAYWTRISLKAHGVASLFQGACRKPAHMF
jgi:hypothetical protein